MTAFRLIPLPVHGALEMLVGIVTMAAPFVLGFGSAATVIAVVAGAVLIGMALSASATEPGRGAVRVSTHYAADYGLAIGLLIAAAAIGSAGDARAALTLAVIALVQLVLNLTTRYSLSY